MNKDEYTISETMFQVGNGHSLYVQEWGNKSSPKTFLFLHGGPGSGCSDGQKQLFNPKKDRVIFFDQRGSGKSTPKGSISNNQMDFMISDINKIILRFSLKKVILVGGSWGSTLALTYAIRHQENVESMILRGIFTARKEEIAFMNQGKFSVFFPDIWEDFLKKTPKEFSNNPTKYHADKIFNGNENEVKKSALAYSIMEGSIAKLDDRNSEIKIEEFDPSGTKIEVHYIQNGCFIPKNYIFDNAQTLSMPIWLVQGRYDAVCPPKTAYELNKILPNSQLIWTSAGHSGGDRANYDVVKTLISNC